MYRALNISGSKEGETQGLVAKSHSVSLTAGEESPLTHQKYTSADPDPKSKQG